MNKRDATKLSKERPVTAGEYREWVRSVADQADPDKRSSVNRQMSKAYTHSIFKTAMMHKSDDSIVNPTTVANLLRDFGPPADWDIEE